MAKSARREVMANAPIDESRSRMSKLHSQMRSRLSLSDPDSVSTIPGYTAATGNQLQNQGLTNRYGTGRSHNGLVVGGTTTYKRGMTVPESKSTPTSSNYSTGSAGRKHLGAHSPAENCSWILVNERTLEEITSRVNKRMWRRVNR